MLLGASPSDARAPDRHTHRRRPTKRGDVVAGSSRGGPVGLPWRRPKSFVERPCGAPSRKCLRALGGAQCWEVKVLADGRGRGKSSYEKPYTEAAEVSLSQHYHGQKVPR